MLWNGEHGRGKLGINLSQLRRYDLAQQSHGLIARKLCDLDNFRAIVVKAGLLCDFRNAVSRVDAFEPEPPPLAAPLWAPRSRDTRIRTSPGSARPAFHGLRCPQG